MKVTLLSPGVILVTFPTQKELVLTMCRVQEFYEAHDSRLRGKNFTWAEFLDVFTSDDGTFTYFLDWAGFNIPGDVFNAWSVRAVGVSDREVELIDGVLSMKQQSAAFYIIGMLEEDTGVLDHEVAHARFYLDPLYNAKMQKLNDDLEPAIRKLMVWELLNMGYSPNVVEDELQAYLATSDADTMYDIFDMEADEYERVSKPYVEVFYAKS